MDAVIKYLTVRTDEEIRRLDKMRKLTGRSALRAAVPAQVLLRPQSAEEAMQ